MEEMRAQSIPLRPKDPYFLKLRWKMLISSFFYILTHWRPVLWWAAINTLCASCGYLNHISTFQCLDFMFVWVLLYLSSSGADLSCFWLLVSMRKSNGLCFCLSQSPKRQEQGNWQNLSFFKPFYHHFFSLLSESACGWAAFCHLVTCRRKQRQTTDDWR